MVLDNRTRLGGKAGFEARTALGIAGIVALSLLAPTAGWSQESPAAEAAQPQAPAPTSSPAGAQTAENTDSAGPFVFGSPPSAQANRLYSVNVRNGAVGACQFERPEGSLVGVTRCFPRDASAGPGEPGLYDILTTRYSGETGIFRVNARTGEMSVCYVRDMPKDGGGVEPSVVCTAPTMP